MSATILSDFYDIDMLYKQEKGLNMNAFLDKKAVGAPLTKSNTTNSCSYTRGFSRSNSTSNVDSVINSNKYSGGPCSNLVESSNCSATTAIMNKENKFRGRAYSESGERSQQLRELLQQKHGSQINSTRYKTELCRPFEENGTCKYGEKCQFAHGYHELRNLSRHPKYKTERCRTFHTTGYCPYGPRCHFIHNADERRPVHTNANLQGEPKLADELCGFGQHVNFNRNDRPKLHHSLSFSGFGSDSGLESAFEGHTSRTPPPPYSLPCSSNIYEDTLSPIPLSYVNGSLSLPGQDLKALLAPLAIPAQNGYNQPSCGFYGNLQADVCPTSPQFRISLRRLSESPVFDSPPSPPNTPSDRESCVSGSRSSSGSLSGSESPSLDAGRRLPIFSRLSISDD
ncbi:mRNA decay activator protein ZFP36L2-A-like [Anguilla anguilla]|uniref:mRNA decay activator protein ZFP36L2-A-like n=1 Tax=Anguilla anguilla TaxID=7936 RepID=UPI0015AA6CC1|nr:mRNA decay activator protein ZFP36L2-A-like [Anguilla anguilla]